MSPAPLFHLPSALRRLRTNDGESGGWRSPKRSEGQNKAQEMLGISTTDMRIARNQSIASTTSNRSQQPDTERLSDIRTSRRMDAPAKAPKLELKASSVLLHEEFLDGNSKAQSRPPMPIKNFASSSTLHSYYEPQKVPLSVSQQTSESSRRDLALRRGNPPVINPPFAQKDMSGNKSPRLSPAGEGRKLSKQRPKTSETSTGRMDDLRPDTGHESVPSIKSMNRAMRSRNTPVKPTTNTRRFTGSTNKSLLEPMDPACVKVNVRRPRVGAKHWFDGLEEDSSEEDVGGDVELQPHFFTGLENAFQNEQIRPPSDRSSVRTDPQTFHFSSSSVTTPKQFLRSQSSAEGSPRVAVLNAKSSKSSLAQHSTRSYQQATVQRKTSTLTPVDPTKNSFLNLSASDDETEDEGTLPTAGPVRLPALKGPPIRDSVVMAFNNDSAIEIGTAHELPATASTRGPQHSRIRKLKVIQPTSKAEQIRMPVPRRGSSLALSSLHEQAERQSAEQRQSEDLIPSFPATPTESDNTAYRMSVSVFSDTASIESRRMMSVTKQEESLLAAMRLKRAAMKQTVTRDKRLQTLNKLEQGVSSRTPPLQLPQQQYANSSVESMGSYYHRQPVQQPYYGEDIDLQPTHHYSQPLSRHHNNIASTHRASEALSRASGTTFQTHTTSRQSRLTPPKELSGTPQLTRLSMSSDSLSASASPSLLSLNTQERRVSRDTYFSGTSPPSALPANRATSAMGVGIGAGTGTGGGMGHSRQRTESSHFSHVVELDQMEKVADVGVRDRLAREEDVRSQDFIDWPYRGWVKTLGVAH